MFLASISHKPRSLDHMHICNTEEKVSVTITVLVMLLMLYVMHLFIVTECLLLWDSAFSSWRPKLRHPIPYGKRCEHDGTKE
jgi:hypothetical protein